MSKSKPYRTSDFLARRADAAQKAAKDAARAHARQMGAVATIDNAAPDAVKQVMEATGGGAAAAIDFVGSPKTMEFGVNILKKGGKLVMVGLYGGAHSISTVLFPFKM